MPYSSIQGPCVRPLPGKPAGVEQHLPGFRSTMLAPRRHVICSTRREHYSRVPPGPIYGFAAVRRRPHRRGWDRPRCGRRRLSRWGLPESVDTFRTRRAMSQITRVGSDALEPSPAIRSQPGKAATMIKPNPLRLLVGFALGGFLAVAGVGLGAGVLWMGLSPLWCVPGVGLLFAGSGLIVAMRRLASLRLWVSPTGFAVATLGTGDSCRCYQIGSEELARTGLNEAAPREEQATTTCTASLNRTEPGAATSPAARSRRPFRMIRLAPRPTWPQGQSTVLWAPPTMAPQTIPRSGKGKPAEVRRAPGTAPSRCQPGSSTPRDKSARPS
jgi:hypothetical protein